jgi:hypothetical protein
MRRAAASRRFVRLAIDATAFFAAPADRGRSAHFVFLLGLLLGACGDPLRATPPQAPAAPESQPASRPTSRPTTPFDGPYVTPSSQGGFVARSVVLRDGKPEIAVETIPAAAPFLSVTVPGLENPLRVALRGPAVAPVCEAPAPERLFVVSDIEGEAAALVALLRANGVIDAAGAWTFGAGHVVYLGDVFDRGDHVVECLWLLYELEARARAGGGEVHFVLGNHEVMNFVGDFRYVRPKYAAAAEALGGDLARLHARETVLGDWLRTRPAALKLGSEFFVHGGVSPAVAGRKPTATGLSSALRAALARDPFGAPPVETLLPAVVSYPQGILWYRGYFEEPRLSSPEVAEILAALGVERLIVGHTVVPEIGFRYEGRVLAVDVHHAGGISQAALREGTRWFRTSSDGARIALRP